MTHFEQRRWLKRIEDAKTLLETAFKECPFHGADIAECAYCSFVYHMGQALGDYCEAVTRGWKNGKTDDRFC